MTNTNYNQTVELVIHALCYATLGWRVFPLVPRGKKALIKAWQHEASTNPNRIRAWWKRHPDANVGILTGKSSGLVVLDVDTDHNGDWSLMGIELLHGKLPKTLISYTGNGGYHYLFTYPSATIRNSVGKLGDGLDVRGNGGYIVAPPSQHPNGTKYVWQLSPWTRNARLACLPAHILQNISDPEENDTKNKRMIRKSTTDREGLHWIGRALELVHSGEGRNHSGMWLACQLRDWGFNQEDAKRYMLFYVDMVPKKNHPYTMTEALKTLDSAYSWRKRNPAENDNGNST